jgi:hypothetical protein
MNREEERLIQRATALVLEYSDKLNVGLTSERFVLAGGRTFIAAFQTLTARYVNREI